MLRCSMPHPGGGVLQDGPLRDLGGTKEALAHRLRDALGAGSASPSGQWVYRKEGGLD